ncbi:MAG: ankyrin repeat domain-containing protein [Planctomycetota bacterium]|nr:MAG: ankyrin repeat domain-containing protein [Planctomycetota bacterium]
MKLNLSIKLAIFIILLFAIVIATCLLWTPLWIKYHLANYHSTDIVKCSKGIKGMLSYSEESKSTIFELIRNELKHSTDERRVVMVHALFLTGKAGIVILSKLLGCYETTVEQIKESYACSDMFSLSRLQFTSNEGYALAAMFLLSGIDDVNVKDNDGFTLLHKAAMLGEKVIAELLINRSANINAKEENGATPLHTAVVVTNSEIVKLLIENGADLNSKDENGETPLHWAAREGNYDIALILIEKGADINATSIMKETPLDSAYKMGHDEIVNLLRTKRSKE